MNKLIYCANNAKTGKPVTGSMGQQVVLVHLVFQSTHYVLLRDFSTQAFYIERVKKPMEIDIYRSDNFERIEDEDEWNTLNNLLKGEEFLV